MGADRILIHTDTRHDPLNVRIKCRYDNGEEEGYITLHPQEDLTLGYNCELQHKFMHIPQVTVGVSVNYENGIPVNKTYQHTSRFSLLAVDNKGDYVLGFSNNRFKKPHDVQNTRTTNTNRRATQTRHDQWPTILSICLIIIGIGTTATYLTYLKASR